MATSGRRAPPSRWRCAAAGSTSRHALAAHHTSVERAGDKVRLRVLFAAVDADEDEVRGRIDAALSQGQIEGPDGITRWQFRGGQRGSLRADETEQVARLIQA